MSAVRQDGHDDLKETVRKMAEAQRKREQQDQIDAYINIYGP